MHKSQLAGFIIDCQTESVEEAAGFWASALEMKTRQLSPEEADKHLELSRCRVPQRTPIAQNPRTP